MLNVKRVVLKIGTSVLLDEDKRISIDMIQKLARQVKKIKERGVDVILVTSGAIASGMEFLGLRKRPREIEKRQALASIGQIQLMKLYVDGFEKEKIGIGQILLTHEDSKSKTRCLNLMNTLNTLISMGIVPVINENDALSFKEIRFGDNDNLSALIAQIADADLLLLLSDVDGLCDKDPTVYPDARVIDVVKKIDEKIERLAEGTKSEKSAGGMVSKLEAAKKAAKYGIPTRIVRGTLEDVAQRIVMGEDIGTLFLPGRKLARNKWWTAFAFKVRGRVSVDDGGVRAIYENGKSLLPSGIFHVEGDFTRGDCIEMIGPAGEVFAKGITNYSSSDIGKIKGLKSIDIEKKLGYKYAEEVVHRNNMVVI